RQAEHHQRLAERGHRRRVRNEIGWIDFLGIISTGAGSDSRGCRNSVRIVAEMVERLGLVKAKAASPQLSQTGPAGSAGFHLPENGWRGPFQLPHRNVIDLLVYAVAQERERRRDLCARLGQLSFDDIQSLVEVFNTLIPGGAVQFESPKGQ